MMTHTDSNGHTLVRGDLVKWAWKTLPMGDAYWCMSRIAVVLADGRMVDTFWHKLGDTEYLSSSDHEISALRVTTEFVVNVVDLEPGKGPANHYANEDTFYLCDGGGGSYRRFQRKGALPIPALVLASLKDDLVQAEHDERGAQRRQVDLKAQIQEREAKEATNG